MVPMYKDVLMLLLIMVPAYAALDLSANFYLLRLQKMQVPMLSIMAMMEWFMLLTTE